jgi:hypothetical protein
MFSAAVLKTYQGKDFLRALRSELFLTQYRAQIEKLSLDEAETELLLSYVSEAATRQKEYHPIGIINPDGKFGAKKVVMPKIVEFFDKNMLEETSTRGGLLRKLGSDAKPRFKVRVAHQLIDSLATIANNLMH